MVGVAVGAEKKFGIRFDFGKKVGIMWVYVFELAERGNMGRLTPKQQRVLGYLADYIERHGTGPTYAEIAAELGLVDKKSVTQYLAALEAKGYIRRERYGHRSVELMRQEEPGGTPALPLAGRIAAGRPLEAVENIDYLAMTDLIRLAPGKEHFLLQVSGDSMIEDGIHDGDLVVVEKRATANNGDTVVALLSDNSATLKRYYREAGRIRLQPANSSMKPRYVRRVTIQGVVKGIVRSLATSS
jgi:repressor LexA